MTDEQAREYVRALRGFYTHAIVYVVVNVMLFAMDMATPGGPWFFWPLLGWGVGLGVNAVALVAMRRFGASWENRKLAELGHH